MRKYKGLLTNNGNIVVVVKEDDPTQKKGRTKVIYNAFITPKGEWLREAGGYEVNTIEHNGSLLLADVPKVHDFFDRVLPKYAPVWEFVGSILIEEDYRSYKPETCNDGGDYAFYTNLDVYHININGKSIIRGVTRHSTSAKFSYDELNGSFQTNLTCCTVLNTHLNMYDTQGYDTCFLEQISQVYKLEDIYIMKTHVIELDEIGKEKRKGYDNPDKYDVVAKLIITGASFASVRTTRY